MLNDELRGESTQITDAQKITAILQRPRIDKTAIAQEATQNLPAAGRAASIEARERYSWNSVFERLFKIYTEVVNHYSP